jgi:hypothetical protein
MKPAQAIGYALINSTAISAIVGSRINHGLRPNGTATPCINYYELGGFSRNNGMENAVYSINCRHTTAGGARDLARLVLDYFAGTSGTGTYHVLSTFEVTRASLVNDGGLIPESTDGIYNAPIDIRIVYPITAA